VFISYSSNTLIIEPDLSPTRIEGDGTAVHVASYIGSISQTALSVSNTKSVGWMDWKTNLVWSTAGVVGDSQLRYRLLHCADEIPRG